VCVHACVLDVWERLSVLAFWGERRGVLWGRVAVGLQGRGGEQEGMARKNEQGGRQQGQRSYP